jgi:DNA-binding NarL/FixJ family response regulator
MSTSVLTESNSPVVIRVALVEDDPNFRDTLQCALSGVADMALVATASTRADGLNLLKQSAAHVLICDLGLPDGSGIDVIAAAQNAWPNCAIMVATMFGDEAHVVKSIEAGAAGYLLKDSTSSDLIDEIRSLHAGGSPISPFVARQVLRRFRRRDGVEQTQLLEREPVPNAAPIFVPTSALHSPLSVREHQTLDYITKGFTMDEIAHLQGVSPHTVKNFVRRIYAKLEVNSKTEAIFEARQRGLLM